MSAETLSANTLFHFTREFEYLKSILKNGFYPRFCSESVSNLYGETPITNRRLAMVCFCDIPLSKVKYHIKNYGNYGIGLQKSFAHIHGISPVLYADMQFETGQVVSDINLIVTDLLKMYVNHETFEIHPGLNVSNDKLILLTGLLRNSNRLLGYTKPYSDEKNNFYNEREWRFTPEINGNELDENGKNHIKYISPKYDREEYVAYANAQMEKHYALKFDIEEIKYIIIKNDEDFPMIIDVIDTSFPEASDIQKKKLYAKIITVTQMEEDF